MRRYLLLCSAGLALNVTAAPFVVSSPDIQPGKSLTLAQEADVFGCKGENRSPALNWSNAPAGTRSFAVTVYDPDAPTGSGWWHWVVVNLPASAQGLPGSIGKGESLPEGAREIRTDYGTPGFGGACPPPGDKPHHYHFTVWALKVDSLALPDNATAAMAGYFLNANALGKATLTATYKR